MRSEQPTALTFPLEDPARIVCPVMVGTISPDGDSDDNQFKVHSSQFQALWDTGATHTMVVPRVIRAASLKAVGFERTAGIDGSIKLRKTYHAVIVTPSGLTVRPERKQQQPRQIKLHSTTVIGLERDGQLQDIDILIGMDIIGRGHFALSTGPDGRRWVSYLHPTNRRRIDLKHVNPRSKRRRGR